MLLYNLKLQYYQKTMIHNNTEFSQTQLAKIRQVIAMQQMLLALQIK